MARAATHHKSNHSDIRTHRHALQLRSFHMAEPDAPQPPPAPEVKKKKICCACPETKAPRDACVVQHGPEDPACAKLIEAHNMCLRAEGFNV